MFVCPAIFPVCQQIVSRKRLVWPGRGLMRSSRVLAKCLFAHEQLSQCPAIKICLECGIRVSAGSPVSLEQNKRLSSVLRLSHEEGASPKKLRRTKLCPLTMFPHLSADARVASRLNKPEHIVVSLRKNSVKWLSRSSVHVRRVVDVHSVQVEFMPTASCSPCLSLHSVEQCTCLNRSSLICRLSGGPLSLFGEFYSPGPCQKIA